MYNRITFILPVALGLLCGVTSAAENYIIDPAHTSLTFSVRHLGINSVRGHFDQFEGSVLLENGQIKEAACTIKVPSINTGVKQRDDHLRSPDFFDAANYPTITFRNKKVEKTGDQTVLIADFTIRGVTKELRLPVKLSGPIKDAEGKTRIGLEGRTTLNRKDYGIHFNATLESGIALVGDEVVIEINAEALQETS